MKADHLLQKILTGISFGYAKIVILYQKVSGI